MCSSLEDSVCFVGQPDAVTIRVGQRQQMLDCEIRAEEQTTTVSVCHATRQRYQTHSHSRVSGVMCVGRHAHRRLSLPRARSTSHEELASRPSWRTTQANPRRPCVSEDEQRSGGQFAFKLVTVNEITVLPTRHLFFV